MDTIVHISRCISCGSTENLVKNSFNKKYGRQYYHCGECNKKKQQRYYHTVFKQLPDARRIIRLRNAKYRTPEPRKITAVPYKEIREYLKYAAPSPVFQCKCGKRFIKTRGEKQKMCLFCIYKP